MVYYESGPRYHVPNETMPILPRIAIDIHKDTQQLPGCRFFRRNATRYDELDVVYPLVNIQKTMENHHD